MTSLTKTSKIAKERKQLGTIENTLIAYALSRGKLPMAENDQTQGNLDYMELKLSTADEDSWVQPYQYAVTKRLTETNPQNFCVVLYQLQNSWFPPSANADNCRQNQAVCVTDTTDSIDNGWIASNSGYHIAAYISSRGENRVSNGKNNNQDYEYELASNPYDADNRDDLVQELTFADLSTKICNAQNTTIKVNFTGDIWQEAGCPGDKLFGTSVNVTMGQSLYYGTGCQELAFKELARCDATGDIAPCVAGNLFDGEVEVNP